MSFTRSKKSEIEESFLVFFCKTYHDMLNRQHAHIEGDPWHILLGFNVISNSKPMYMQVAVSYHLDSLYRSSILFVLKLQNS